MNSTGLPVAPACASSRAVLPVPCRRRAGTWGLPGLSLLCPRLFAAALPCAVCGAARSCPCAVGELHVLLKQRRVYVKIYKYLFIPSRLCSGMLALCWLVIFFPFKCSVERVANVPVWHRSDPGWKINSDLSFYFSFLSF